MKKPFYLMDSQTSTSLVHVVSDPTDVLFNQGHNNISKQKYLEKTMQKMIVTISIEYYAERNQTIDDIREWADNIFGAEHDVIDVDWRVDE